MNVRVGETRKKKKDFDVFNLVLFVYLLTLYDHDYLHHSRFRRESLGDDTVFEGAVVSSGFVVSD